jgi:hypothetical protein
VLTVSLARSPVSKNHLASANGTFCRFEPGSCRTGTAAVETLQHRRRIDGQRKRLKARAEIDHHAGLVAVLRRARDARLPRATLLGADVVPHRNQQFNQICHWLRDVSTNIAFLKPLCSFLIFLISQSLSAGETSPRFRLPKNWCHVMIQHDTI